MPTVEGPTVDGVRDRRVDYWTRRHRLIAYGRWNPVMDAEPVRAHVEALLADGLSLRTVAALAGVPRSTVQSLMYGHPAIGKRPSQRICTETGKRLLSTIPTLDDYPPRAVIDATGTHRRVQALAVMGWPLKTVAAQAGIPEITLKQAMGRATVTASTARAVRSACRVLLNRWPAPMTRGERIAVSRTLGRARRMGWVSALAWDDIDDPKACPRGIRPTAAADGELRRAS